MSFAAAGNPFTRRKLLPGIAALSPPVGQAQLQRPAAVTVDLGLDDRIVPRGRSCLGPRTCEDL
jgi:hypothetical protein